jgi:hypothetical protein
MVESGGCIVKQASSHLCDLTGLVQGGRVLENDLDHFSLLVYGKLGRLEI